MDFLAWAQALVGFLTAVVGLWRLYQVATAATAGQPTRWRRVLRRGRCAEPVTAL
jgi:hypothetical protein